MMIMDSYNNISLHSLIMLSRITKERQRGACNRD